MFTGLTGNVINCTFSGNTATGFAGPPVLFGGGILTGGERLTVANSGFCFNTPNQIEGLPINDGGGNSLLYCPPPPLRFCPADIDNDGTVGINDFLDVLANWGPCP